MHPKFTTSRQHGFRLSLLDALILLAGTVLAVWLRAQSIPLWWIVPAALGHFFLFCNVFLVWRRWELLWAALFILNVGIHLAFGIVGWLPPMLYQLPITLVIIALQIRSPWYHGIFAHRLNPTLASYRNGTLSNP